VLSICIFYSDNINKLIQYFTINKNPLAGFVFQILHRLHLEKVAGVQSNIDQANAGINGTRIALKLQCIPDMAERVDNIILSKINGISNEN